MMKKEMKEKVVLNFIVKENFSTSRSIKQSAEILIKK